jgi:hypothetical protein
MLDTNIVFTEGADAIDMENLEEAGGLVSWLTRWLSGSDTSLPDDIEAEIKKIRTEKDKDRILADIAKFRKQAKTLTGGQLAAFLIGPMWVVLGIVGRLIKKNNGTTEEYIKAMDKLEARVNAIKIEDK